MNKNRLWGKGLTAAAVAIGVLCAANSAKADAVITLTGPTSNAGTIDLSTADGQYGGLVSFGGVTGYSLWGLLGGAPASSPTSPVYGAITTTTPPGDNGKNAILRYYVLATSSNGSQSLVSLGEINPTFTGSATHDLVTSSGNTASLAFTLPGAGGRDLTNLTSLQLLSVPALPALPTGVSAPPSTSITLTGNVSYPGAYTFQGSDPQNVSPITETVNGDTYTGPPFFSLIDPSDPDILNQYVVTAGTDGYEVLFSLAELDPTYGASTAINEVDLVPYADTGGNFPGAGIARIITPGDTPFAHGRWVSNLDLIDVAAVPEPATTALLASGLIAWPLVLFSAAVRGPATLCDSRGDLMVCGRRFPRLRVLLAATILVLSWSASVTLAQAPEAKLVNFAAASLKDALDEANDAYQREKGQETATSYAASSTLAKQIEAAAPADIFISADLDWMDYLAKRNLIKPETRANLLGNRLVLIAPVTSHGKLDIAPNFPLARALGDGRLAIADPNSVPAGKYGKAALEALGVWSSVANKLAPAENVRATLLLVSRGEAPLGIVYQTDANSDKGVQVVGTFPDSTHPPIIYPIAVVTASINPGALGYVAFLKSPAARPIFEKQGFTVLQ